MATTTTTPLRRNSASSNASRSSITTPRAPHTRRARGTTSVGSTSGGSTSYSSPRTRKKNNNKQQGHRGLDAVWAGRLVFVLCLVTVASLLGFFCFFVLSRDERRLAENQFESIAERALVNAQQILERKRLGTITLASIVANTLSNANDWPFVALEGYEEMATNLIATSSGREMGLAPLISPDQLDAWEDFAYDYYETKFPNTTAGLSSFGKGIWGVNASLGTSDNRYHDNHPHDRTYDTPNNVSAPLFRLSREAHPTLMLNLRFEETRGKAIDALMECAEEKQDECGGILSDFLALANVAPTSGPGALIFQPIFPTQNKTVLTGLISSSILWREVLLGIFNSEVRGIDCIIESETQAYSYEVRDGEVLFAGKGDLHQAAYEDFELFIPLTLPGQFNNAKAASYTLKMYPTQEFFNVYSTSNAVIATAGVVGSMMLTCLLFFIYDCFVRRDIQSKQELLEAKRAFVRFVSHEVRTPLNSVIMGLTLLQEDMTRYLVGFSAQSLPSSVIEATLTSSQRSTRKNKVQAGHDDDDDDIEAGTVVRANASSLRSSNNDPRLVQFLKLIEEIHENTLRSVVVLNDLLNYDKIEMGNLKLELVVIPIQELIETTAKEFLVPASQKQIDFQIDFTPVDEDLQQHQGQEENRDGTTALIPANSHDCRTVGDDIRIAQVVRNLLSNSLKFTRDGGSIHLQATWISPSSSRHRRHSSISNNNTTKKAGSSSEVVAFTLKRGEEVTTTRCGMLQIDVIDSGAGMTQEQVATVFADGVQFNANELQKGNGTGLGLHIAKGIMELHGGDLVASSAGLGKGSTFSIMMPLYHLPDTEDDGIPEEPLELLSNNDVTGDDDDTGPMRILVVDDAAMNRKLLIRLLTNHGHECDDADDGEIAVAKIRKSMEDGNLYNTVLLDHEMPKLSGPEAAKQMRDLGSDVFIVGVTGNLLPDDVDFFKRCGANSVLPKPFKLEALEQLWVEYGIYDRGRGVVD